MNPVIPAHKQLEARFFDPPLNFRPLQVIHGFDYLQDTGTTVEEAVRLLKGIGCGGAVVNVGWKDYLVSEEQWKLLERGLELMKTEGLRVWLYDEEGYPSGTAGGRVLKGHPEYEACGLVCIQKELKGKGDADLELPHYATRWVYALALSLAEGSPVLVGAREVVFREREPILWNAPEGRWLLLGFCQKPLFEGTHAYSNLYARRRYPNLMTPEAAKRFCELTHDGYARRFPQKMGKDIVAVFTDEPSLLSAYDGEEFKLPPVIPWEERLPEYFAGVKGYSIWSCLPCLFLDIPGCHQFRCDFYDVVSRRVADSFFRTIRLFCRNLGIASTGHLLGEEFLSSHVLYEGNLLVCLRELDVPGVDILSASPRKIMDSELFLVPKIASSVAHITGREHAMAEHSDYSERQDGFKIHPLSMEERLSAAGLLYALGINILVSYYPWRPGGLPIDPQGVLKKEPFGSEYRRWTDFVSRLSMMSAGGTHVCQVAILYPIWGVQAYLKPTAAGSAKAREIEPVIMSIENGFVETCRKLLLNQWDFDIIDDRGLREAEIGDGKISLGKESYRAIVLTTTPVIPACVLQRLLEFKRKGCIILTVGKSPEEAAEPHAQKSFEKLWEELVQEGMIRIPSAEKLPGVLARRLKADISLTPPSPVVSLHRRWGDRDVYLLVNTSAENIKFKSGFSAASQKISIWWPDTGSIEQVEMRDSAITVELCSYRSAIVVLQSRYHLWEV